MSAAAEKRDDGLTYYLYELNAPEALASQTHSLSAVTVKGDLALVFVAAASEKQWAKGRAKLAQAVESFRA